MAQQDEQKPKPVVPRGKAIDRTEEELDDMTGAEAMEALDERSGGGLARERAARVRNAFGCERQRRIDMTQVIWPLALKQNFRKGVNASVPHSQRDNDRKMAKCAR